MNLIKFLQDKYFKKPPKSTFIDGYYIKKFLIGLDLKIYVFYYHCVITIAIYEHFLKV